MKALSLQIAAAAVVLLLGIPLTLFPLKWARTLGWSFPEDVRLARYFGRCLGAVLLPLCGLAWYGSSQAGLVTPLCATVAAIMLIVAAVHVVGALEKAQPPFETAEIAIYLLGGGYFAWLAIS